MHEALHVHTHTPASIFGFFRLLCVFIFYFIHVYIFLYFYLCERSGRYVCAPARERPVHDRIFRFCSDSGATFIRFIYLRLFSVSIMSVFFVETKPGTKDTRR